jgi:hypothetical protein
MFEQLGRVAHRSATSASRRQFLGSVGRAAMLLAAAAGGLLALPDQAEASAFVCGRGSASACRNRIQGSPCGYGGRCANAPHCYCAGQRRLR